MLVFHWLFSNKVILFIAILRGITSLFTMSLRRSYVLSKSVARQNMPPFVVEIQLNTIYGNIARSSWINLFHSRIIINK